MAYAFILIKKYQKVDLFCVDNFKYNNMVKYFYLIKSDANIFMGSLK